MLTHQITRFILAAAVLGVATSTASAQRPGTFEAGAFGRFTAFDNSLLLKDRPGFGGRLGAFVAPGLEIEGTGSFTPTRPTVGAGDVSYIPLHARLVYNLAVADQTALLLGAGFVHNVYGNGASRSDNGAGILLGVRQHISQLVSLRLEGLADYMPSPANAVANNWNVGVQVGLSLLFGGAAPADSDGDGVADRNDQCLDTPAGETVNALGCALDADRDGVSDRIDRCADTPAGEPVDAAGCPRDTDRDGVRDSLDRCPNTVSGEAVDANGCARDTDGDGVTDGRDRCAGTARGVAVDASGCPRDSDGDGVLDAADRCGATPSGTPVDASGCPRDGDGDGVMDGTDRCPNSAAGARVDAVGCPVLFAPDAASVVLEGVNFATGSAVLTAGARGILDTVAQSLVGNPDIRVEVGGHTDNTGNAASNVRLSQARAESVRQYLIEHGVAADRMTARGYGAAEPVADNATPVGRAANRRVALRRIEP